MRIAMIGSRGLGAHEGGVERLVETLADGLSAFGHEVLVYGRRRCMSFEPNLIGGRTIITPGFGGKHLETLTHTSTACLDVLRRDVDVVHVHSPGPALLIPLLKSAGLPVVLTIHAPDWRREKWSSPARLALRAGLEAGMRLADRVTAVAPHLAKELSETHHRDVVYVPNAVDCCREGDADDLLHWGLQPEAYALHVGRAVPEKKLDVLLEAWAQAELEIPLAVAGVIGESRYARRCRQLAPPNVRWLGSLEPQRLTSLYAGARFLAQPSVLEGASLVLMEAACQGRCVIATDMPANREVLGEAACWVPPQSPVALVEALIRCNSDAALRRELGDKARQHVTQTFTIQTLVGRMERMYMSVQHGAGHR
jgi:glycosyltransferase involved in cell wall biosynthesis